MKEGIQKYSTPLEGSLDIAVEPFRNGRKSPKMPPAEDIPGIVFDGIVFADSGP